MRKKLSKTVIIILLIAFLPLLLFLVKQTQNYLSFGARKKADISVDAQKVIGPIPKNWQALAQGGEEKGVRMLEPVIKKVNELNPRYIRIDHIYDFYNVVSRNRDKSLKLNWKELDKTVCDILRIGAKPFFSLSYMPEALSKDKSLISPPSNWKEWSFLVQKTIERYSGINSRICGLILDKNLDDVYYEVWNEPDLESFGKWSLYNKHNDYKLLYYYSSLGAQKAKNVKRFFLGGPATTAAYKNWFQIFLNYITANNLRIDFLSWHHYSKNTDDFTQDMVNIDSWLKDQNYAEYKKLPRIISEWGFDSNPNPLSETNIAAAHTVSAIRNLIEQKTEMAFAFEIKDGKTPRWGILSYEGKEKPRFKALKLLNSLGKNRLLVSGEGSYVKAIASREFNKIVLILVNYDLENKHTEAVPVKIINLKKGVYGVLQMPLDGKKITTREYIENGNLRRQVYMPANSVVILEILSL